MALAMHSIPSFTIAATNLLTGILESHPPTVIVTHAELLLQLLELIYDAGESDQHHTIIIVGEPSAQAMARVASKVKVLKWEDVEREGVKTEKILSPVPSMWQLVFGARVNILRLSFDRTQRRFYRVLLCKRQWSDARGSTHP